MSIKDEMQSHLDESGDGYQLKTNEELIDIIREFGCGETGFHTADIERLIKENESILKHSKKFLVEIICKEPVLSESLKLYLQQNYKLVHVRKV